MEVGRRELNSDYRNAGPGHPEEEGDGEGGGTSNVLAVSRLEKKQKSHSNKGTK